MYKSEPLTGGQYYHINNRGYNGEILFREERNYPYSLKLYAKYVEPVADTCAYCLMSNHFHFLFRVTDEGQDGPPSRGQDRRSWAGPTVLGSYRDSGPW